ncbi:hypothetical protein C1H46_030530 [Malus baccata]|uniref:Uncharacterized protein n=1 Tax=Malus baccata TaxID=106549 RepID=A0A540LBR2_MALBA|nr:hypothetical protein C1H46_030530 [Malus baccata]
MLKIEFQTLQKGSDSINKFLSRLKSIRDQLLAAGEHISENDFIIVALSGLPREYAIIRTVILARENTILLKEFRVQLLILKGILRLRNILYLIRWLRCMLRVHLHRFFLIKGVHLHRFLLIKGILYLILNLMLMFHLKLLVLLLLVPIILPLFHRSIQLPIMLHLLHIMSHHHHLHHFRILLLLLDMALGILVLILLLDLNHRIICLLPRILFNQGLSMVVPKEILVVTNITKAEVIMEATSKDDGLVTLILVLLCNLSVRFVREGVTQLLTVFTEILHLLLISLNVKFVGNVDTLRWSVIIEAIMLIKAVVHLSHFSMILLFNSLQIHHLTHLFQDHPLPVLICKLWLPIL